MTRRLWCVLVQAGLCATALPACAPLGGFLHSETGRGDAHLADNQRPANPPGQGGLYPDLEEAEAVVSAPQRPGEDLQLQYALLLTGQKPPLVPKQGWGVKDYSDPPPVLPPVGPPLLQMPDGTAEPLDFGSKHEVRGPPAPPPEDLAAALNCLLRKQHAAALAYLDRFDKGNQEVFLSLLSALAVLNDKRLDQLTPEEAAALEEQF